MRITKLQTAGVKGPVESAHDLSPVTIITGDNFAGKTAKLDALRIGLIGYLPELGKRPSDTFALAANGAMRVALTFDTGNVLERSWKLLGGGTVRSSSNGNVSIPAVLIDPSEYFGLGDKDRVRYVFKLAAAHVEGAADAVISRLKGIKIDGHSPLHEAAIDELVSLVDETDRQRHEEDRPVPQWLEELIGNVRDRLKASRAEADRMAKTVGGMAVIECQDDEATARNVKHELGVKREQFYALQKELGKLQAQVIALEGAGKRRQALQERIANSNPTGPTIAELTARLEALVPKAEAPRQTAQALTKLAEVKSEVATATTLRDNLSDAIEKAMDELEGKKRHKECPFCGAQGEGWMAKLLADHEQGIKAMQLELTKRESELQVAAKALRVAETAVTKAKQHDAEIDAALKEATAIKDRISSLREADQRLRAAKETLAELPQGDSTALKASLETRMQQEATLEAEINRLAVRHDRFIAQQQSQVLAAKASERLEQIKATVAVEAEAVKLLEALQTEMVRQAFGSILGTANRLTDGILKGRLDYHNGEIGRWQDGLWISHHSFSGTEKALAYAGISVALAAQSPVKIVLLDEMGRLTDKNKAKVVDRLAELIKDGVIGQAVCVDVDNGGYAQSIAAAGDDKTVGFIAL